MVEADITEIGMSFEQKEGCSEELFRKLITKKIRDKAFIELQQIQKGHEKVRHILFSDLSGPQTYDIYKQTKKPTV